MVVLRPGPENPALSTVTARIMQLLCVRSHSLELATNSRPRLLLNSFVCRHLKSELFSKAYLALTYLSTSVVVLL